MSEAAKALITVIIPVYNRAAIVEDTLRTIAAQTFDAFRLILVDNGSTDKTTEVLALWAAKQTFPVAILSESRRGACAARNAGLEAVETPWVMFFDSDDLMAENHLADFAEAIRKHPDADIVGRPVVRRMLDGKMRRLRFETEHPVFNHIFHASLSTQRYAVRTDLIRRVGGWDPRVWGWNDLELGVRLLAQNPRFALVAGNPGVTVVAQADSITGTAFCHSPSKWEDALDTCERNLREAGLRDLLPWIDCRRAILAANYRREGARTEARRLYRRLTGLRLKLVYAHQRWLGRGASLTARILFPKTPR